MVRPLYPKDSMGTKRPDHQANRRHAAAHYRRQSEQRRKRSRRDQERTQPSPVTITRADGSVVVQPALTPAQLRRVVKERPSISPWVRAAILFRDGHACRYCGIIGVPLELDHVVPVSLGGATSWRNLVAACRLCNQEKGVKLWKPRPLPLDNA